MDGKPGRLRLFTLAGVFTAPHFLDEFRERTAHYLSGGGWDVTAAHSLLPYGDWSRSRARQAAEIAADLCLPAVGGRRVVHDIGKTCGTNDECGSFVLIGHSGGGVAAAHAANRLSQIGYEIGAVVMIGSPKTPLSSRIRDRTAFVFGTDPQGRPADAVARIGGWRGRGPDRLLGVNIIGGHRDYFRSAPPYMNAAGVSNLSLTTDIVGGWLMGRLSREPFLSR